MNIESFGVITHLTTSNMKLMKLNVKVLRTIFSELNVLTSVINGESISNLETRKRLFLWEVGLIKENEDADLEVNFNQLGNVIHIQL
jgi:hypothetical protein